MLQTSITLTFTLTFLNSLTQHNGDHEDFKEPRHTYTQKKLMAQWLEGWKNSIILEQK